MHVNIVSLLTYLLNVTGQDNHDSHISIPVIEFAKENGIIMLSFPPHCSHKLQPLDRSVYGPLKKYYNVACDNWMVNNPGKPMAIYEVAQCVAQAFPQAFTATNTQAGFRVSGISPFNSHVFTDDEFMTSYVTDRPQCQPSAMSTMEDRQLTHEQPVQPTTELEECNRKKKQYSWQMRPATGTF